LTVEGCGLKVSVIVSVRVSVRVRVKFTYHRQ
jgi:hypothetical protein